MPSLHLRRLAVPLAASLALLGLPLAGTALAAQPVLQSTSPADGAQVSPGPTVVSATYDVALGVGSMLELARNGSPVLTCLSSVSGNTVRCTSSEPLPEGVYLATATARVLGENAKVDTFRFTVDTTPPATPTVTVTPSTIAPADQAAVRVAGATEPGANVAVSIDDSGNAATAAVSAAPVTADEAGAYSVTLNVSSLSDGVLTATAVATDAAGNRSTGTGTAVKDTTAPVLVSVSPDGAAGPGTTLNPTTAKATFDEPLADSSVLSVRNSVGNVVSGAVSFADENRTVVFTPAVRFTDGTYTASWSVADGVGNSRTGQFSFTIDGVAPANPTVVLTDPVNAANAAAVPVSGTADEPGLTVLLSADDANPATSAVTRTAVVAPDKTFSTTMDLRSLDDGRIDVVAVARDAAGNTSAGSGTDSATKDTRAPAAPVAGFAVDRVNAGNVAAVTVGGTGERGSSVVVSVDDADPATSAVVAPAVTVSEAGSWTTAALDLTSLSDGTLTASAVATDAAGNASPAGTDTVDKDVVAPLAPQIETGTANAANAAAYPVSGTAEPGSTVFADAISGDVVTASMSDVADEEGAWSLQLDVSGLPDGSFSVRAQSVDGFGNTSPTASVAAVKDTVAPAGTTVTLADPVNAASAAAAGVSGAAEPGASVAVSVDDADAGTAAVTGTATADETGSWETTLDLSSLAEGTLTATAVATDAAGNSAAPVTDTATKDTVAPGEPSIAVTSSTGDVARDGATVTVSGALASADRSVAGQRVDVTLSDGVTTLTGADLDVPTGSGEYSVVFTAEQVATLADGVLTATATATDAAGNPGPAASGSIRKNVAVLTVTGSSPADGASVQPPATVSVSFNEPLQQSGEGASTITLRDKTGNLVSCARSFSADGRTILCTPAGTLSDAGSPYTVEVNAQDLAGETKSVSITFTVDSVAPAAPTVTAPALVGAAGAETFEVTVTDVEDGAVVAVTVTGASGAPVTGTATEQADGSHTATLDVSDLPDGPLTVTATATDAAGNQSAAGEAESVKDTAAPTRTSTSPADGSSSGAPSAVTVVASEPLDATSTLVVAPAGGSAVAGTTSFSEDRRTVTFTPAQSLAEGAYTVSTTLV
ncbi:MAG TPA: Ig-like domain-containing protein, partial [Mycobacteriales bacterium]|nr:Ig-like domain-containing protein [Mycobacteriales bacterium]